MSAPRPGTPAGTVASLARYPVKGMAGETLDELRFGWHGPDGDRVFALLRLGDASGLPFVSPRRCPAITSYAARTEARAVIVTTPIGVELDIRDPRLLDELQDLAGEALHVVQLWSHATDSMDVSIITNASVAAAGRLVGRDLAAARFRPNIVLDTPDDPRDHPEDRWIGRTVIGGTDNTTLHIGRATQRCTTIDIDPHTGAIDNDVFTAVRDHRRNRLGVYATVQRTGTLTTSDSLTIHH